MTLVGRQVNMTYQSNAKNISQRNMSKKDQGHSKVMLNYEAGAFSLKDFLVHDHPFKDIDHLRVLTRIFTNLRQCIYLRSFSAVPSWPRRPSPSSIPNLLVQTPLAIITTTSAPHHRMEVCFMLNGSTLHIDLAGLISYSAWVVVPIPISAVQAAVPYPLIACYNDRSLFPTPPPPNTVSSMPVLTKALQSENASDGPAGSGQIQPFPAQERI